MKIKNSLSKNILLMSSIIGLIFAGAIISQRAKTSKSDSKKINSIIINSIIIDSPESDEAKVPKFFGLDTSFLDNALESKDIDIYKKEVEALNRTQKNLWGRKVWDLKFFQDQNFPVIVGKIKNKQLFSSLYQNRGLRFLDLPIYMPGQGWRIPIELDQFKEVIKMAVDHERLCHPDFEKDHYVYITVDQGHVEPQTSQRRAGWHSDSYRRINNEKSLGNNILVDHVYVIYDNCPTLYVEGPFSFDSIDPNNIDEVLKTLSDQAASKEKRLYPSHMLLRMDPYCIHDAGINDTDKPIDRTFVKISFSKTKYRHLGNVHNNLFIYDWPMVPRKNVPYTKGAIELSSHRKDRDSFLEIDPLDIDFEHKISNVPWASNCVQKVSKVGIVYAEPAKEGEMLESKCDNSIITIKVAEKGDYKIVYSPNDMLLVAKKTN